MKRVFTLGSVWLLLASLAPFAVLPLVIAQDDKVDVTLEAFIVTTVTEDDGTVTENFRQAEAARPGDLVEYRVMVKNVSEETLAAGTVAVTGPVPTGTVFLAESATPSSSAYRAEFTANAGDTFSEPPVMIMVTNDDGEEEEVMAEPEQYNAVRWTLLDPLDAGQELMLSYRVEVQ